MIYLDNAATSFPKPTEVYDEVLCSMKTYAANPGRGSHAMSLKAASKIMETREKLAELFNIQNPFNIIFTCNATEALNIGIKGLLKPGDHVISSRIEHNSVLRPIYYLTKKGIESTLLEVDMDGFITPDKLKKEIRGNTRLIVLNHASNVLGTVQPIRELGKIARASGVPFMVDASQSAGVIPIDVEADCIDLLAFPGHKGLLGPQGTGVLYIREGIIAEELKEGGTGSNSDSMEQPDFLPDKFESGTLNTPGIAGLCEGIKFIQKVGIESIRKHEGLLMECLVKELKRLSNVTLYGSYASQNSCPVLSFNIHGIDSSRIGYLLNKNGIAVRTGYHCAPLIHNTIGTCNAGTVRLSPGYFNTDKDIEALIRVLREICAQT